MNLLLKIYLIFYFPSVLCSFKDLRLHLFRVPEASFAPVSDHQVRSQSWCTVLFADADQLQVNSFRYDNSSGSCVFGLTSFPVDEDFTTGIGIWALQESNGKNGAFM